MSSRGLSHRSSRSQRTSRALTYSSDGKPQLLHHRRFLLKLTPIEARDIASAESGRARNVYCTLVLLDAKQQEIKGEKQRTPPVRMDRGMMPVWSPLKATVLQSLASGTESHQPLGIGAAAAAEEYTFGINVDLAKAKYLRVKCKDKGRVETEDLGRLLLELDQLDPSGNESIEWYELQARDNGKAKRSASGKLKFSIRLTQEPGLKELWACAEQMRREVQSKDRTLYLKLHPSVITGKEASEWMLRHGPNRPMDGGITCSTLEEVQLLGNCLVRNKLLIHTTGDQRYVNGGYKYYRFAVNDIDKTRMQKSIKFMQQILNDEIEIVESDEEKLSRSRAQTNSVVIEEDTSASSVSDSGKGKSKSSIKIDDFELLQVLGTGTFGRVLSARGPDGRIYAIKIISKIGMDETMRRNAKIERDMLREIDHPFVASLLFAFQNEDKVYMGMEFFNGGDLRRHMQLSASGDTPFTPTRIQLYAAEIVAGLAHLHAADIIYRDLKPENILLQKDGHVVIVDFGLSTYARASDGKSHSLAGSPEYIAPEVLLAVMGKDGKKPVEGATYGKECDWWSLGILLFEMFIGRTPFKDDNQAIMYRNIREGSLYIPPEVPEEAQSLIQGLLEKEPEKRLGAADGPVPESIMQHPFFENIDWDALQKKEVAPEWVPDVVDDSDVKYVDEEFVNQEAVDTPEWRMLDSVDREREYLNDFTYQAPKVIQR